MVLAECPWHITPCADHQDSAGSEMSLNRKTKCIVYLAFFTAAACGDQEQVIEQESTAVLTFEQYVASITRVFEGQEIYVVDGDIAITRAELRDWYERYRHQLLGTEADRGTVTQATTVNQVGGRDDIWSEAQAQNLTYCVSTEFGGQQPRMVREMAQATADLEAVGNFDFIHIPAEDDRCTGSNPNVLFAVRPWARGGACAFFPSGGGCVPRTVVIDLSDFNSGRVTSLGVLRHELGHVLGLRHEHIRASAPGCGEDGSWRPVTSYDSDSMMHYPWCPGGTNTGDLVVTPLDAQGIGLLYPGDGTPPPPPPPPPPTTACAPGAIDFSTYALESYANQDAGGTVEVENEGDTLLMVGNTWKRSAQAYTVTPNTVLEFEFASANQGEIHAIGFDNNQEVNDDPVHFHFWGFQNWTGSGRIDYTPKYSGTGNYQRFRINVGQSYTGANMRLVLNNDNDTGSSNNARFRCIRIFEDNAPPPPPPPPPPTPGTCPASAIDFTRFGLQPYADQDAGGAITVEDNGDTLAMLGNTWKRSANTYRVTPNTVVEFEFASTTQGEIHAIGFDDDQTLNDDPVHFNFWGLQTWTGGGRIDYTPKYTGNGDFQRFRINVGQSYTGSNMRLVFANDNDAGPPNNNGRFRCVQVYEDGVPPPPPSGDCSYEEDFEGPVNGWTTSGTCQTGTFVLGTPTEQTSGVTTQPAGAAGGVAAAYTAGNSSVGVDDVDGGECVLLSPVLSVSTPSTLSAAYFHGQRDTGDDPAGDYFVLEVSVNGGATFSPLVSLGDEQNVASWTNASGAIPAGASVQLRVRVSDGVAEGDIIEAGLDEVSICN